MTLNSTRSLNSSGDFVEEYARVLDYLPQGRGTDVKREPLCQLIGESQFTLLEASVRRDTALVPGQRVFVGRGPRKEIYRIKSRINYSDLTASAKQTLLSVLKDIIASDFSRYIDFLNKAGPISMRVHQLELIPGIGKKNMEIILSEREKEPFKDLEDLKKRVPGLSDPVSIFAHRIINELEGKERYYYFIRPPHRQ